MRVFPRLPHVRRFATPRMRRPQTRESGKPCRWRSTDRRWRTRSWPAHSQPRRRCCRPISLDIIPAAALGEDPSRAQQLMAQAGYPEGQGFPDISLVFHASDLAERTTAKTWQAAWKEILGIDTALDPMEEAAYQDWFHPALASHSTSTSTNLARIGPTPRIGTTKFSIPGQTSITRTGRTMSSIGWFARPRV